MSSGEIFLKPKNNMSMDNSANALAGDYIYTPVDKQALKSFFQCDCEHVDVEVMAAVVRAKKPTIKIYYFKPPPPSTDDLRGVVFSHGTYLDGEPRFSIVVGFSRNNSSVRTRSKSGTINDIKKSKYLGFDGYKGRNFKRKKVVVNKPIFWSMDIRDGDFQEISRAAIKRKAIHTSYKTFIKNKYRTLERLKNNVS